MTKPPRPHSDEWFTLLSGRNPQQAAMAERTIKAAGTAMCCGICGDTENVHDYMGDEEVAARLCDDCKSMQESMHGAMFVPFI
jgi:hypothetical protein